MYFPIIHSNLNRVCTISSLFHKEIGTKKGSQNIIEQNDEEKKLKMYAQQLMPLMYETWLEVRPQSSHQSEQQQQMEENAILVGTFISNEAAYSLKLLLNTVTQLWELMLMWNREVNNDELNDWFSKEYSQDFNAHMIVAFPYSQGETGAGVSKHKSKGHLISQKDVEQSGGVKCLQQNLNICFIFCCLNKQLADENVKFSSKIVQYLDRESCGSFEES
jgi:pre-rRNA-processing protein IPI1